MVVTNTGIRHFETVAEFIGHLRNSDEIEFAYRNERYWIIPSPLMLYKSLDNHYEYRFETVNDLLAHKIHRSPLRDIITWVDITHTLYP